MFNNFNMQLVEGGFRVVLAGGFDIAVSWGACFFVYVFIHIGSKVYKLLPKRKK